MSNDSVRNEMNAFPTNGASPGGASVMIPDYSAGVINVYHVPPGSYPAEITAFKESRSQAGNDMLVFEIKVDAGYGKTLTKKLHCTMP